MTIRMTSPSHSTDQTGHPPAASPNSLHKTMNSSATAADTPPEAPHPTIAPLRLLPGRGQSPSYSRDHRSIGAHSTHLTADLLVIRCGYRSGITPSRESAAAVNRHSAHFLTARGWRRAVRRSQAHFPFHHPAVRVHDLLRGQAEPVPQKPDPLTAG